MSESTYAYGGWTRRLSMALMFFLGVVLLPRQASAVSLTYQPSPSNMGDLDHHLVYLWRIDNIVIPSGQHVSGANLTIKNIANWDNNPNMLFIHMFDTARYAGLTTTADVDSNQVPVTDIQDAYANVSGNLYSTGVVNLFINAGSTVSASQRAQVNGIGNTFLTNSSFSTVPDPLYTYNYNASQVVDLINYIANGGDVALGLDPDCHFFNDGVTFNIFTSSNVNRNAVPEPASLTLLGLGLAGLYRRQRRARLS